MARTPLHILIATSLREDIHSNAPRFLPSLTALSKQLGVSLGTASRAVHLLADEGLLRVQHGKRIAVIDEHGNATPTAGVSAKVLVNQIRSRIDSGEFGPGTSLPSVAHFTQTSTLSSNTVCQAFQILYEIGLIKKRGKLWIVHPRSNAPLAKRDRRETVLVVLDTNDSWQELFCGPMARLGTALMSLLDQKGYRVTTVLREDTKTRKRCFPMGKRDAEALIQKADKNYAGTIVVTPQYTFPDLEEWLATLCEIDKPVIWLDTENTGTSIIQGVPGCGNFFRCYIDERQLARTAFNYLVDQGHTRILVPLCGRFNGRPWFARRVNALRAEASRLPNDVVVDFVEQNKQVWAPCSPDSHVEADSCTDKEILFEMYDDAFNAALGGLPPAPGVRYLKEFRQAVYNAVPSLQAVADTQDYTAILGINQWAAVNYYYWLKNVGVKVPERVSLLGLDDHPIFGRHPVSTVRWGLQPLAQTIAEILSGRRPPDADRNASIGVEPVFMDRGSVRALR